MIIELIIDIISNTIVSFVGLVFLWIKFRGKKSIKELRKEAEEESFAFEGWKVIIIFIVTILFVLLPFGLLISALISYITDNFL